MAGKYELKQRAESQRQTRERIARAALELHQELGPAATTVSDIARRAGVGRVTVYRHFADESEIFGACSGLFFEENPPPDIHSWREIPGARERLRHGLAEAYDFHRRTEKMMSNVLADIPDHDAVQPYYQLWAGASKILLEPWAPGGEPTARLRPTIALVLSFYTWRQLVREQGLAEEEAIALAEQLVVSVGSQAPSK